MKKFLKCLVALTFFMLLAGCSNDDNDSSEQPQKRILRYFVPGQKDEYWIYDEKKRLTEIIENKFKTTFTYDEQSRVIKVVGFPISNPEMTSQPYLFHYNEGEVIMERGITNIKYILNSDGQPIQELLKIGNSYKLQKSFTYQNGNMVKMGGPAGFSFRYDNKKNVLADYPIGIRLFAYTKYKNAFGYVSKNNIISVQPYVNETPMSEIIYELTYDSDGYLIKSQSEIDYQTFSYW